MTATGIRQCFILAFVHVATRRVYLSPDTTWMRVQARAFLDRAKAQNLSAAVVLRDRDAKYDNGFDAALEAGGCRVTKAAIRAPNMNAYVERFVQGIQQECLDRFIVFGRAHLDHVVSEYAEHYHAERPHQAVGNLPLVPGENAAGATDGEVVCTERLGGMLQHYFRRAA